MKRMQRRTLPLLLLAAPAMAQRPPARIGWLTTQRESSLAPFLPALRAGLAEAGLVEGRGIELLMRFGDDDQSRALPLMEELLRDNLTAHFNGEQLLTPVL
jgi:putative ABC transport system substrate-binding protein